MNTFSAEAATEKIVTFLRQTFKKTGIENAVIALSGGIDSATSAALLVQALGAGHVYPLMLPYGQLNHQGVVDATEVADSLAIPGLNRSTVDIEPLLASLFAANPDMTPLRKGNAMARMRMIVVFDWAKKLPGLVVGTENRSEHLLGYYTRFGDEASDVEPIRTLYKTQVYQVAKFLKLPEMVITKAPTAGLWEGQTDEGEFGFTYAEADEILNAIVDRKQSPDEISKRFPGKTVEAVLAQVNANHFKHNLPYSL